MPTAPTNVQAKLDGTTYPDSTTVVLTWDRVSDANVHSYLVQRSDDGGSTYGSGSFVPGGFIFAEADTLTSGTTYYYRVSSVAHEGNSAPSSPVPIVYIDSPAFLTVALTDPPSPLAFDLTWGPVSGADTYRIERTLSQSNAFGLLTSGQVTSPFTDDIGTVTGNEYTYAVRAENSFGVTRRRVSQPAALPPACIVAMTPGDPTSLTLAWDTTNYVDVSHFDIGRSTDGGSTFNDSFAANVTGNSRADNSLTAGTTYIYHIRARSDTGFVSAWSDPVQAQLVGTVDSVAITPAFGNALLLNWGAPAGATTYIVERKDGSADPAVLVPFLGTPTFTSMPQFLDSAYTFLRPGQDYTYFIYPGNGLAYRDPTQSPWTATAPEQFVGEVGVPDIHDRVPVKLSWKLATYTGGHVVGLLIEKSTDDGANWSEIVTKGIATTEYTEDDIALDSTVLYRISAALSSPDISSFPTVIAVTSIGASCTAPLILLTGAQTRLASSVATGGQQLPPQLGIVLLDANNNLVGAGAAAGGGDPGYMGRGLYERPGAQGVAFVNPETGQVAFRPHLTRGFPYEFVVQSRPTFVVPDVNGNIGAFQGEKFYYRGPELTTEVLNDLHVGDLIIFPNGNGVKTVSVGGRVLGAANLALALLPNLVFVKKSVSTIDEPNQDLDYFGGCKGFPYKIPDGTKWANQPWYIARKQETWDYNLNTHFVGDHPFGSPLGTPSRTETTYFYMGLVSEGGVINPGAGKHLAVDTLKTNTAFSEGFGLDTGYNAVRLTYYPLVTCHGDGVFWQARGASFDSPGASFTTAFPEDVRSGSLLVVPVSQAYYASAPATVDVTDSQGNTYTQAGSYVTSTGGNTLRVSLWYTVSSAAGPCTVTVAPSDTNTSTQGVWWGGALEYTGFGALEASSGNFDNGTHGTTVETGPMSFTAGGLAIALASDYGTVPHGSFEPGTGYNLRLNPTTSDGPPPTGSGLAVWDNLGKGDSTGTLELSGTFTESGAPLATPSACAGATFG